MAERDLWELANAKKGMLRFSTLFTAQNVRDHISDEAGLEKAIAWCKQTAVTRVYIESYRSKLTVERSVLERAKRAFEQAGFDVSGCVTTTEVGKQSTGWKIIDCYTDKPTQKHLLEIFAYTASVFDEIMIDDFYFTDCECEECEAARGAQSWAEYRCDLLLKLSKDCILGPARAANPNVKIILKYPQWYDRFHLRGYAVERETREYDKIWIGTETRDPDSERWGKRAQYMAYYIMRWLGEIGGAKTGGGWFDPFGTSPPTYVEQARQTVLGDAKEALLFCYGALQEKTGPANVVALRKEIPGLFELAALVRDKPIRGVPAPKPPDSDPGAERHVFDYVGMLGIPLVPTAQVPEEGPVFLSVHALKDRGLGTKLERMIAAGTPLLVTDGLREALGDRVNLDAQNVQVLRVAGEPRSVLAMDREPLGKLREQLLAPLGIGFDAPSGVALYLMGEALVVIENFNDARVDVEFRRGDLKAAERLLQLPSEAEASPAVEAGVLRLGLGPRSLVAVTVRG